MPCLLVGCRGARGGTCSFPIHHYQDALRIISHYHQHHHHPPPFYPRHLCGATNSGATPRGIVVHVASAVDNVRRARMAKPLRSVASARLTRGISTPLTRRGSIHQSFLPQLTAPPPSPTHGRGIHAGAAGKGGAVQDSVYLHDACARRTRTGLFFLSCLPTSLPSYNAYPRHPSFSGFCLACPVCSHFTPLVIFRALPQRRSAGSQDETRCKKASIIFFKDLRPDKAALLCRGEDDTQAPRPRKKKRLM